MVGSSQQRIEVWKGSRAKTSGGLTKSDLIKNKRGKIVSKRKSSQASDQNNLGTWLRTTGKSIPKDKMLRPKGKGKAAPGSEERPKKEKAAPKQPVKAKPKAKPKAKLARKPAAKPKKAHTKPKKAHAAINPLTGQARSEKSGLGFVKGGKVSLDNVVKRRLRPRKKVSYVY